MKNRIIWCVAAIAVTLAVGCGTQPPSGQQNAGDALNLPAQRTIELGDGVKLELVLIPAGSFVMGDNNGLDDEKPAHKVTITKPFYLGAVRGDGRAVPPVRRGNGLRNRRRKGNGLPGRLWLGPR